MHWLLLTALAVVFRAIYGVMTKVLSNKVQASTYTQAFLLLWVGTLIAIVISPLLGGIGFNFSHVSPVAAALVGLSLGLGNFTYFVAIKNLTNSTAQITFSSILLFTTLLSILFLDLQLSFLNVCGLALLMLAIISVVNGKIEFHRKGVTLMIVSAFLFSVFQLSSSELSKQVGPAIYLIVAYLGASTVLLALKARTIIQDLTRVKWQLLFVVPFLTALPSVGYFLFAYYAYRSALAPAKVAMLLTSQVVVTVFLSYFFLKEKGNVWRKVGAATLVVLAAVLIKG